MDTNIEDLLPDDRTDWLYSLGKACQIAQVTPAQLFLCMRECDVAFRQVIDDVPMIRADDLMIVAKKIGEIRDDIAAAQEAAESN